MPKGSGLWSPLAGVWQEKNFFLFLSMLVAFGTFRSAVIDWMVAKYNHGFFVNNNGLDSHKSHCIIFLLWKFVPAEQQGDCPGVESLS